MLLFRLCVIRYLECIGLVEALRNRVETIYKFYEKIHPDEIIDVFVSDYIKEDGTREYENLWFFSKKYWMEAKQFITKDQFDITLVQKRVYYWAIQKQDYDFQKATENSIHLRVNFDTGMMGEMKASKENCDYLREIFLNYVDPNMKE